MSLGEIRRFRAGLLEHSELLEHIRSLHWDEVVELANAHGYAFTLEESLKYFHEIHSAKLAPSAMTNAEIAAWKITGNPNAIVDSNK